MGQARTWLQRALFLMVDYRRRRGADMRFQYQARLRSALYNRCWRCVWRSFHD